jgi:tetrahydromethanopterin S-methyltransferase subunit C
MYDAAEQCAMKGQAPTTIAGCLALAAFAVAVVAGLATSNAASTVLMRAIIAMIACYPIGLAIGLIAQRVVQDQIRAVQQANPAPDSSHIDLGADRAAEEHDDEEVLVV